MNDLISRQAAIDCVTYHVEHTIEYLKALPSAQPEITLESAIDYLRSIGWMQEHDRIMSASAQSALIAKIQNGIKITDADDAYSCGMRNGMRWCISLIDDKEPAYENCPSAQQWIPVSERPPEENQEVFVYLFDRPSPYIAWIEFNRWRTDEFELEKEHYPLAWMPLPLPYKEEQE